MIMAQKTDDVDTARYMDLISQLYTSVLLHCNTQ